MITESNLIKYILKESDDFAQYLKSSDVNVKQEDNYTTLAELARYILKSFKANLKSPSAIGLRQILPVQTISKR